MKIINISCLAALSLLLNIAYADAQEKTATLSSPPAKIIIDGDIKDWGDSLRYLNAEKHLNYSIANTKDTLYLAIRFNDRVDQMRVLRAGLTFSIDPKGKKKEAYSITFPLNTETNRSLRTLKDTGMAESTKQEREELMRERLTSLRGIKVVGFKDIEDEMITTSNTYGIQTAVNYDDNGYLVCEAAIPLQYFHVDEPAKNEWSFNFRINGIEREVRQSGGDQEGEGGGDRRGGMNSGGMGGGGAMGGGRRGGRGGGMGGSRGQSSSSSGQGELAKSTDFWVKFYLAH
ncbi:MAG TPA: hypothetical protein VFE53_25805 [Mucilaginibacter sp.]|jgi:YD repeat-containing protein|nr:hypothetical protein [Mucilaginibacter sp.]